MGGVDLLNHMKVSYEFDQRNKFRFSMQVLFDFLDIGVLNSQVFYDKIQSPVAMPSVDLIFSLACSMIGNFCNQKRATFDWKDQSMRKLWLLIIYLHLLQLVQGVLIVLQKRLSTVYLFVVYDATFYSASKKKNCFIDMQSVNSTCVYISNYWWHHSCSAWYKNVNMLWFFIIALYQTTMYIKNP